MTTGLLKGGLYQIASALGYTPPPPASVSTHVPTDTGQSAFEGAPSTGHRHLLPEESLSSLPPPSTSDPSPARTSAAATAPTQPYAATATSLDTASTFAEYNTMEAAGAYCNSPLYPTPPRKRARLHRTLREPCRRGHSTATSTRLPIPRPIRRDSWLFSPHAPRMACIVFRGAAGGRAGNEVPPPTPSSFGRGGIGHTLKTDLKFV